MLLLCSIVWFDMGVRLVFKLVWLLVVETFDDMCNIVEYGEMGLTFCVVPVEIQTEVAFSSFPILGDTIVFFEDIH